MLSTMFASISSEVLECEFLEIKSRQFINHPDAFIQTIMQDVLPGGSANPVNRTYGTSAAQPWHVDECDIVGEEATFISFIHPKCKIWTVMVGSKRHSKQRTLHRRSLTLGSIRVVSAQILLCIPNLAYIDRVKDLRRQNRGA